LRTALPPSPFLGAVLARATWLWVGLHAAGAAGQGYMGMPLVSTHWLSLAGTLWIWGFTAFGVHILTTRRGESLILANLGFPPAGTAGMVVAWCAALDGCLQILVSALT